MKEFFEQEINSTIEEYDKNQNQKKWIEMTEEEKYQVVKKQISEHDQRLIKRFCETLQIQEDWDEEKTKKMIEKFNYLFS